MGLRARAGARARVRRGSGRRGRREAGGARREAKRVALTLTLTLTLALALALALTSRQAKRVPLRKALTSKASAIFWSNGLSMSLPTHLVRGRAGERVGEGR